MSADEKARRLVPEAARKAGSPPLVVLLHGSGRDGYDAQIREHITWFAKPDSVQLFDRPNGRRIRFPLLPSAADAADYALEVLSIKRSWIQVQVTVPDTNGCSGNPEAKVERRTRAWVRRHDRRGRYQIAYAPAGC